jgi:hypothetical protein
LRAALTLFFVLLFSQAWGKSLTANLIAFECGTGKDRVPIILKRNEGSWEAVTTFSDQAREVLSPDANTFVFPQVDFVQQFLRFKDGTWRLIEVDKGEVTTLSCEEKNKFVEIIAEGIAPLVSENVTSLRLMQEELLQAHSKLQLNFENAQAELVAMMLVLQDQRRAEEEKLTMLAATEAAREQDIERLQAQVTDSTAELEQTELALAAALQRQLSLEAKLSAKLAAETDLDQLAALKQAITALQKKDSESQEQLRKLGNRLNAALARAASEQRRRLKLEEAERQRLEAEMFRLQLEKNNLE